jgi:hypothetical protein
MALEAANFERRIRDLHGLAEEARTIAESMHDPEARRTMRGCLRPDGRAS